MREETPTSSTAFLPRNGIILFAVAAVLCAYTVLFLVYGARAPSWGDEVQFTDPAANLFFHNGFVTTAWPYETANDVFFGNAPLFSLALAGWFKITGFGLLQARVLSWLFCLIGVVAGLGAAARSNVVPKRLLPWLALLFLTGYGVSVSIWSIRYDMLGFALVMLVLHGLSGRGVPLLRWAALFLMTAAGFHLVFVIAALYALRIWFERRVSRETLEDLAALVAGGLAVVVCYAVTVGLKRFAFLTLFSNHTVLGQTARSMSGGHVSVLAKKLHDLAGVFYQDPPYTLLLLCALALVGWQWRRNRNATADPLIVSLAFGALVLPVFLCLIGKYPDYYSWIGWSCLCPLFLRLAADSFPQGTRTRYAAVAAVCTISFAIGLMRYLGIAVLSTAPPAVARPMEAAIAESVRQGEIVYADDTAYFPARQKAKYVYAATYAQNHFLPGFPTVAPVTTMIVQEGDFDKIKTLLGGAWHCAWKAGAPLGPHVTPLEICRRSG